MRELALGRHVSGRPSGAESAAASMAALSPGAPAVCKNGNFKTGDWTAEAINERKWLRSLVQSFAKSGTTE